MHNQLAQFLNSAVAGCNATVNELVANVGDKSITVESSKILEICQALKASPEYDMNVLHVVSGTDFADRIEVSYFICSYTKNTEVLIKTKLPRGDKNNLPKINSVVSVWPGANFHERETYDLVGVDFVGHPDLRRILCPYDWDGHPLRRDYVVQEKYLDMVVNPPGKNNTNDQIFGKRLRDEIGDPKRVSFSWKDDSGEEAEAKDGE
jgi:NADH-quinone oxidoreductase subunit C